MHLARPSVSLARGLILSWTLSLSLAATAPNAACAAETSSLPAALASTTPAPAPVSSATLSAANAATASPPGSSNATSPVKSIDGGTVTFNGFPSPVKTDLHDLLYLGQLRAAQGEPYFLFSGKRCKGCASGLFLHVIHPASGKVDTFVYPGKIFLPRTRELVIESRAFFGRCVPGLGDAYLAFQREKVGKRRPKLVTSVYVAEAAPHLLREKLYEKGGPKLKTTLQLVKSKSCHEIDGRNRVADLPPVDTKVLKSGDADDADDVEGAEDATESKEPKEAKDPQAAD